LLRFFEAEGEIRRALSMIKKRTGAHEPSIRELIIESSGLKVGAKLNGFRGILGGTPTYVGETHLLEDSLADRK
jgi:circadian clock protein KaiC